MLMYDELLGEEAETRAVWSVLSGAWRVLALGLLAVGTVAGIVAAAVGVAAGLDALGLMPTDDGLATALTWLSGAAGAFLGYSLAWRAVRRVAAHRSPNGVLILATPTTSAQPSHVKVVSRPAADAH
jgi:hypothetical protein